MGEIYDYLSGRDAQRRGEELLRAKDPPVKGLSAETAADLAAGEVEIDADDPQAQILRETLE